MVEPTVYTAITLPPNSREVTGYYVKHINATPPPIATNEQLDKFLEDHTEHFIMKDGFSDWMLPRQLEGHRIDISTMRPASG